MNNETTKPETAGEPYAGYQQEILALEKKLAELRAAAAAPLPGPLREAFAGDPPKVGAFALMPVTAGLVVILVRINSPLLDIVRIYRANAGLGTDAIADIIGKELKPEPEQWIETVFCFVTEIRKLRALLAQGREAFREQALQEIGDKLHPTELAELEKACGAHFASSFATIVEHEASKGSGGEFFTQPPAEPMTASAGGSTSSAK
jgi:hypothetical protein